MNPSLYPIHNEWRYGLFLSSGSRHISVSDLTISATGGDGICIAYAASDIHLARLHLDDNYRNALTITNGKDLLIEDCVFSNTSGTAPSAGVDIEPGEAMVLDLAFLLPSLVVPHCGSFSRLLTVDTITMLLLPSDWAWSDLSNITFRHCQFIHNWGAGFSMAPGGVKPWNRTKYPGVPACARELNARDNNNNNSACPISVSIEDSHFEGFGAIPSPCESPCAAGVIWPASGSPRPADCKFFDCAGCVFETPTCSSTGEQFGILYAGTHPGVPGTFRVSDTTIVNTALSGLFVSEKAASGALFVVSNVSLINTAANLTSYANWIWKSGWLNSPVVIQNDSPGTFGSAGGMVLDGLTIINDRPRPW
jgi:hypothetical protein